MKGQRIDIRTLDEFDLDSLRDCVYDFIPENAKLCMYSSDDIETFGKISNLTKKEFIQFQHIVKKIEPVNPKWKDDVIVVLKKPEKITEFWRNLFKPLQTKKKRKYCCSKCKGQGHNRLNKKHK